MFHLPEPTKFCFCMNLKIGSLIIGIFSLIGSLINIFTWISGVRSYQLTHLLYQLYNFDGCEESCKHFVAVLVLGIEIVVFVLDSLHVIMSSLLIHGIRKEKPNLFIPFLSWQATRLIINLGLFITLSIVFRQRIILIVSYLTLLALSWSLEIYFFLVINAYKLMLCRAQGSAPIELRD